MTRATLALEELAGESEKPAIAFLHGLLGRGENWRGFARRLLQARPDHRALLIDLRMHGASQGLQPPHTLRSAADDVARTLREHQPCPVVVGHSFGGKVALSLLGAPPAALRQLWILDASPSARAAEHPRSERDTTGRVLQALSALPPRLESRAAFTATLAQRGIEQPLILWLAKNLVREEQGLRFGLDLQAIGELLADYDQSDLWSLLENLPAGVAVHFVLAGHGSAVSQADRTRLRALGERACISLHELPSAGHWLHTDDPQGLLALLERALS